MKRLWVAAALAPLSFAAAARAEDKITTQITTPVFTATATSGAPDDVTIAPGGSIQLKTAGTASAQAAAATINSNNTVTNNGSITTRDLNYTTGILGLGGFSGTGGVAINNTSTIQLDESSNPKINGTNGIAEGPFATGTNRFGIEITGASPLVGSVTSSGTINVVGENSAGIFIGSGGLTGKLTDSGGVTVTGDNSFGIHAAGAVSGDVVVSGAVNATGQNATGLALDQGAGGKVDIANTIAVTGFHSLTPPVQQRLIDSLQPSQLLAGGPAVSIAGSVAGGISIDAPTAAIPASGSTPAVPSTPGGTIEARGSTGLVIGGAGPITIGAGSSGAALFVGGPVVSAGTYQNFDATAIQIGTAGGGPVTLNGGIDIAGNVNATTVATDLKSAQGSGQATGLHIMSGANVGSITVSGNITASSTSTVANTVTGIQIDAGAAGGVTLTNSGAITASIGGMAAVVGGPPAAGGTQGTATAVSDQAGALSVINNTGRIGAAVTPIVSNQTSMGVTTAFDLRANTTGVSLTQSQAPTIPATSSTPATTPAAPAIVGDVLFGSGNANLNLQAGTLTGAVAFGSGTNSLSVDGGAVMKGDLTQAAGGILGVNVGATGAGTLNMTNSAHLSLSSLNIGSKGQVVFTVDPAKGVNGQFAVNGDANLAAGSKIGLNLVSVSPEPQVFDLITTTGTLTSDQPASSLLGTTPFLFNASIGETTGPGGSVNVTVGAKTAAQLSLNPAETAAYDAVLSQLKADQDAQVTAAVLSKTNRDDFIHLYDQFLPDYSGGVFDSLVVAQAQIAQAQAEAPLKLQTDEVRGWVQEIGYLDDRQNSSTINGYRASGFGFIGGLEQARGDSAVGVTAAFVTDGVKDDRQGPGALLTTAGVEVGVYWREGSPTDGLAMHASANGGYLFISNHRQLFDETYSGTVNLFREAKSQWNGFAASAEAGVSYQAPLGRFYIRPEVIADYVYLYESAFTEKGGGPSMDLSVASRNNSEASVTGDLVVGADLGGVYHWRPELTIGWRQVVSGGPGDTSARFVSSGPSFVLSPRFDDKGSLLARLGVRAGGDYADFSADAGGLLNNQYQVYNARAVARFLF
jgi:hypothetical protein